MKRFFGYIQKFLYQMKSKHFNAFAASIAFFYFLSFVPILMVLCTVLPYTPISKDFLIQSLQNIVPTAFGELVETQISDIYIRSGSILPIAAIILLWTACKGMMALMDGLNKVYDLKEERNYFIIRFIACLYTLLFLVVIIIGLFLVIVGKELMNYILMYAPYLYRIFDFIMSLRYVFSLVFMTLIFSGIYTVIPSKKRNFILQLPGALATSLAWICYSMGFSWFLRHTSTFSIYGSLSVIITLMIWLYFCMYFVLVGAQVNVYIDKLNSKFLKKLDFSKPNE